MSRIADIRGSAESSLDHRKGAEPEGGGDDTFEALLRRAAQVSEPFSPGDGGRLSPGTTLLNGRLRIDRRVGEGGMGVVYEAFDAERRSRVALKSLGRLDPDSVYRLKYEFRSLADVSHPNLVRLHELTFSDGDWFFTMELIAGARFDEWVRPNGALDEARLRSALDQLFQAVNAIHRAGKLHRDLKPSNVLVTRDERLVVLDFGLAVDDVRGGVGQTVDVESVTGTPAYMAPEQAAGADASAASDYYAIGVMLFEALTGRLPFEGRLVELLAAKQREAAPAVASLAPHAPDDLAQLCDALLARAPAMRPSANEVAVHVGPASGTHHIGHDREPLIGRDRELAELQAAFDETLRGNAVVVFVTGQSGMGKSALVAQFLDELRGAAAVLAGRCYERESVPYKAFDTIVDDLSRYLRRLPAEQAAALMPRDVFALARLFPVLERVHAVAEAPKKRVLDVQELQERAFAAFSELLGRLRDRRPVVAYVDDVQWTDRDSSVFMEYLFTQPEPSPMLLIIGHRSEGAAENALLRLTTAAARRTTRLDVREIEVGPLDQEAARRLAQRLLGESARAMAIAEESQGSPFFVGELARDAQLAAAGEQKLTLQEMLMRHVQQLPLAARALLDVLAVAGRPMTAQLALDAASATHEAIDVLRAERLLRVGPQRSIECYHDKIRELVALSMAPAALREVHRRIAAQLMRGEPTDPEHLALHFHGAGEHALAARHYERVGDSSVEALAFDHAARQYEHALALVEGEVVARLRLKLAAALASAGSSREAAMLYRAACEGAAPADALEYTCTAARLLATSGYIDEGRDLLGEALQTLGLSMRRSRGAAIAAALLERARLKLRGLALNTHARPTAETEAYLAAVWTVVQGAVGNRPLLMVEMATRYTRVALDNGARADAARGLSMEAYMTSFRGPPTRARTEPLLAEAAHMAEEAGRPEIIGWVRLMHGCSLAHQGQWHESRPVLRDSVKWFETRCQGVPFKLALGRAYYLNAGNHLGYFSEIAEIAHPIVENSLRRGDMFQASSVCSFAVQAWLANRGLEWGRSRFFEAKARHQAQSEFGFAELLVLKAEIWLALYEGAYERGLALLQAQWRPMHRAQLLRMEISAAMMHYCRAGLLLNLAGQSKRRDLQLVNVAINGLEASTLPHARGWGSVIAAGAALRRGDHEGAAEQLRLAISRLDSVSFRMYAAAARRRLGQLLQGEEGGRLLADGAAAMASEGVLDAERSTEMLTPGCACRA